MNNNDFDFTKKKTDIRENSLYLNSYKEESDNLEDTYLNPFKSRDYGPVMEVHLPKKPKVSNIIMGAAVVLFFLFLIYSKLFLEDDYSDLKFFCSILGMLMFSIMTIVSPFVDRHFLKKVCTVRTEGILEGYEIRTRSSRMGNYNVYAPKYKIFINGHYEIRTLDDFTRSWDFSAKMDLLVNPDGYEIMPADGRISRSGRTNIILVVIFLVVALFIMMPFFVKRVF